MKKTYFKNPEEHRKRLSDALKKFYSEHPERRKMIKNSGQFKKGSVPWCAGKKCPQLNGNTNGFKKGQTPWNKGVPMSEVTRIRLSKSLKGRVISEETRKKLSLSLRGHPTSEETKIKIGNSNRGKTMSLEQRRKISEKTRGKYVGEKSPNWKGGVTSINKLQRVKFRDTMQKLVFERDKYTCQLCGIVGVSLQVDHIQPWKDYVELRFSMDNCRTLCQKCHYLITFGRPMPKNVKTWGHRFKEMEVLLQ